MNQVLSIQERKKEKKTNTYDNGSFTNISYNNVKLQNLCLLHCKYDLNSNKVDFIKMETIVALIFETVCFHCDKIHNVETSTFNYTMKYPLMHANPLSSLVAFYRLVSFLCFQNHPVWDYSINCLFSLLFHNRCFIRQCLTFGV